MSELGKLCSWIMNAEWKRSIIPHRKSKSNSLLTLTSSSQSTCSTFDPPLGNIPRKISRNDAALSTENVVRSQGHAWHEILHFSCQKNTITTNVFNNTSCRNRSRLNNVQGGVKIAQLSRVIKSNNATGVWRTIRRIPAVNWT